MSGYFVFQCSTFKFNYVLASSAPPLNIMTNSLLSIAPPLKAKIYRVQLGHKDLGLCDTSVVTLYIQYYQLNPIRHVLLFLA